MNRAVFGKRRLEPTSFSHNTIRVPLHSYEHELRSIEPGHDRTVVKFSVAPWIERLIVECQLHATLQPQTVNAEERELIIQTGNQRDARFFIAKLRRYMTVLTFPWDMGEDIMKFLNENAVGDFQPAGIVRDQRAVIYCEDEQDAHLAKLTLHTSKRPIEVRTSGVADASWESELG